MPLLLEGGGGGDLHPLLLLGTPFQAQAYFLVKVTLATSPYLRTSTRRFYPPCVSNGLQPYWTVRTPFKPFIYCSP
jgi:hypothetical protein